MIKANAQKYSVSAMCRVLQIPRSTYYYEAKAKQDESELTANIIDIFKTSRNNYGTRKKIFSSLYHLQIELADYVNWFNNHRIHSSLGYLTPVKYRMITLKKVV